MELKISVIVVVPLLTIIDLVVFRYLLNLVLFGNFYCLSNQLTVVANGDLLFVGAQCGY